jgi:hypothetical protein
MPFGVLFDLGRANEAAEAWRATLKIAKKTGDARSPHAHSATGATSPHHETTPPPPSDSSNRPKNTSQAPPPPRHDSDFLHAKQKNSRA